MPLISTPLVRWFLPFLAVVGTLLIYGQTKDHGFGFDDELTTQLHPLVGQGLSGIPEILRSNYIEVDGKKADYRPLARVSFAIEQSILGAAPGRSHLINIGFYLICIWLLYILVKRLVPTENQIIAGISVLIFSIHPIHTEVVASLKNREELLAALFALSAWVLAIRYMVSTKWGWLALALLSFILALLSKISAAPFALIIPFSLWYFKKGSSRSQLTSAAGFALISLLFIMVVISFLPWEDRGYQFIEKPIAFISDPAEKWSAIFASIGYYMKLAVWPYPQSIYYGFNSIASGWSNWQVWLSLVMVLALTITIIKEFPKRSVLGFGLMTFTIALVPVSNVFYPIAGTVVERGLFLPSVGAVFLFGAIGQNLFVSRLKWLGWVFMVATLVSYTYSSHQRVQQWSSFELLAKTDAQNHPKSAKLHQLLGTHYLEKAKKSEQELGMLLAEKSAQHFKTSLSINDDWAWLNKQLALTYAQFLARPEAAIPYFKRELELKPTNYTAAFNLAKCFAQTHQPDSSLKYIERTLSIQPDHFPSLRQLSRNYLQQKDTVLGFHYLRKLENYFPNSEENMLILAEYRFSEKDTGKAIFALEQAVKINPKNKQTLKFLFEYYYSVGDTDKAEYFRDVAAMN